MKTILYVYHASNIGGGSYAMLNIIKALDKEKYKPVVLLKSEGPLVDELKAMGVEVFLLPLINTVPYNRSIFTLRNIKRIVNIQRSFKLFRALLKTISPDIVYLNTMMLHPYLKIAKSCGIKTIIHVREHWPEKEHTMQRNYAISNIRKYADKIIAINTYSSSMVSDETHHPTIVYDWIDMQGRYQRTPYSSIFNENCSNRKVFLSTGGYDPNKGTLEIIRAFTETVDEDDARLLILGTRPQMAKKRGLKWLFKDRLYDYLQQMDDAIDNDKRIKVMPNTYFITDIYQQAYCVLSYFTIPHANLALAENIILGVPVIAAKNEEAIEYSRNGELAILFEANNFNDFKQKLRDFNKNREAIEKRLSEKSYEIKELFSPERNIDTLNKVYKELV